MHYFLDISSPVSGVEAKWNQIFPLGVKYRDDFPGGKIDFNKEFLQSMVDNWAAEGKPERVINFNHAQPGQVPYKETVAAGWIQDLKVESDGLYALIKWTDEAKQFIAKDQFRYLSPEFASEAISKDTGKKQGPTLFGAALLNTPFLVELPKVAASEGARKVEQTELKAFNKKLALALGLDEDADEEAVHARVQKLCKMESEARSVPHKEAGAATGGVHGLAEVVLANEKAKVEALNARIVVLEKDVADKSAFIAKIQTEKKTSEVKIAMDKLVSEGKVMPHQRAGFESLALTEQGPELLKLLEGSQPTVKMGETGVAEGTQSGDQRQALEDQVTAYAAEHKIAYTKAYKIFLKKNPQFLSTFINPKKEENPLTQGK